MIDPPAPVVVYRSHWRPDCAERAFVLQAVGIGSQVLQDARGWVLLVAEADTPSAAVQLRRYDLENPPKRRLPEPEPAHRQAWAGVAGYVLVLLAVGYLAGVHAFGVDWLAAGGLVGAAVRSGEAWRTVTALTLHFDVAHLVANLGFGAVFGLFAARALGPGVAAATVLAAAAAANGLNALVQPASSLSAGASTAVFATLGLLAGYEWRRRAAAPERRAWRWAPLVAGVFLLGFTGAGGENTDVVAHVAGFATGAVAGIAHARWRLPRGPFAQWTSGVAAIIAIAVAWACAIAFSSGGP